MASAQEVRQYLAYWFQLGKKIVISNSQDLLPRSVIQGDHYSPEFEDCWRQILANNLSNCYLEGTEETIAALLSPVWDITGCARCNMPVPIRNVGMPPLACPCNDLSNWPNTEVPAPRSPVQTQVQLADIRERLLRDRNEKMSEQHKI